MSVRYRIFPEHGLVFVVYEGFALFADTAEAFGHFMQNPDFRPGLKQLVDVSRVTGYEKDYQKLLALQARKAEAFVDGPQSLMVYYAPTQAGLELARLASRSWEELGVVVPVVQRTEADALTVLGLQHLRISDMKNRALLP